MTGKGIVIVITVIFSCLSFTLGYFVGKVGSPGRTEVQHQVLETAVPAAQPPVNPAQDLPSEGPRAAINQADQSLAGQPPADRQPEVKVPETPKETPQGEVRPEAPAKDLKAPSVKQVSDVSKPVPEAKTKEIAKSGQAGEEQLFTVQLGALKSKSEADKFRSKYSKKGYKIYIKAVKVKKGQMIYKIRTGEFREKKDAELLAIKLKKTEGLQTFVVPANE